MAPNLQSAWSVKQQIAKLFEESLRTTVPDEGDIEPEIAPCQNPKFAIVPWVYGQELKARIPNSKAIMKNLPPSEMIESCTIAGPGFVNIILSKHWIAKSIQKMLVHTIETWAPEIPVKRAVVDFSSPNIAKEMHVGNLRSTIIGDTLARMLEFSKVEVLRRNHVGDWGTQFGMLIEYLFEKFPSGEISGDQAIGDLQTRFSKSITNRPTHTSWLQELLLHAHIRHSTRPQSRDLIVILRLRRGPKGRSQSSGESFYNPHIPRVMELLNEKGLIEESDGAHVIVIEGKKIALIVVKKDGGYNYASTDLAALWYRLNEEKAEWIIYVTDVGQREHFEMVFTIVEEACTNLLPNILCEYLYNLSEDSTRFCTNCKVVRSAEETSRLLLCEATAVVMRNASIC
ncbi:Arginine--tRNA ligase, chloroplastic/mitochondrial [Sesamum angolense]|uniref:Arginyl-tRNA synthetase n=1 Tax=Sesamum angolense TaxID=2727404 RepID=A0AAE2BTG6_9LAMI|nr:Arginine--tRNA ligase, chloroplastic/mitochondrial [Sesamum angolense]